MKHYVMNVSVCLCAFSSALPASSPQYPNNEATGLSNECHTKEKEATDATRDDKTLKANEAPDKSNECQAKKEAKEKPAADKAKDDKADKKPKDKEASDKSKDCKKDDTKDSKHKDKAKDDKAQGNNDNADETLKIGNLAFPPAQQPGPLISFGQTLIDKNQIELQFAANKFKGKKTSFINVLPSFTYGITEELAFFVQAPIALKYRDREHHSSGPGDCIFQLEYAFYTKSHRTYYDQATIVGNVSFATGAATKDPPTGFGSTNIFVGGTLSRMGINWFYFVSSGGIYVTSKNGTKFGNQFLYQGGVGRRIANTKNWLIAWLVEIDGTYSGRNRIDGLKNPNSGGNVIYVTPSFWMSTKAGITSQFGVGFPIQQHLFGKQDKFDYLAEANLRYAF